MKLFRITSQKRAYDLSGTGSKLFGGRWNSIGNPVVYSSGTISLAMLEIIANAEAAYLKKPLALSVLTIPHNLHIEKTETNRFDPKWKNFPYHKTSFSYGDRWLESRMTPILQVPSAVNPYESNFLLNPLHPDFHLISIEEVREIKFDLRLVI